MLFIEVQTIQDLWENRKEVIKHIPFRLKAKTENNRVHLFESAIDLLSYATLLKMKNIDWHRKYDFTCRSK